MSCSSCRTWRDSAGWLILRSRAACPKCPAGPCPVGRPAIDAVRASMAPGQALDRRGRRENTRPWSSPHSRADPDNPPTRRYAMRAALATAAKAPLSLTELDVPEPGPDEVLVKMIACGVCYTDLGLLQGHYPFARFPVVPGHEVTGTVVATGPGVTWPNVGTTVGAQFLYDSCGHCEYCR